jgi:putative FmdB family regulatory protein
MPTYEYACRACGHVFEIVQKMSDDPLVICPECGGELRKVFAPPAITFKGSGFYATDHGKKAKTSTGGGDTAKSESSSASSGGGAGSGTKSDTTTGTSGTSSTSSTKKEGSSS